MPTCLGIINFGRKKCSALSSLSIWVEPQALAAFLVAIHGACGSVQPHFFVDQVATIRRRPPKSRLRLRLDPLCFAAFRSFAVLPSTAAGKNERILRLLHTLRAMIPSQASYPPISGQSVPIEALRTQTSDFLLHRQVSLGACCQSLSVSDRSPTTVKFGKLLQADS